MQLNRCITAPGASNCLLYISQITFGGFPGENENTLAIIIEQDQGDRGDRRDGRRKTTTGLHPQLPSVPPSSIAPHWWLPHVKTHHFPPLTMQPAICASTIYTLPKPFKCDISWTVHIMKAIKQGQNVHVVE